MCLVANHLFWAIWQNRRGVSNIIVVVLGLVIVVIVTSNVILWSYEMNQFDWERMQERITIADVSRVGDTWFFNATAFDLVESTSWISGDFSDMTTNDGIYMSFRSYYSADSIDIVDNNTSDMDSSADKGTHSSFIAQQTGPDTLADIIVESNTAGGEQWLSPTGYEDPGDEWSYETYAYDGDTRTRAVDNVPGGYTWSQYLVLTRSSVPCSKVQYYIGRENTNIDQVEISIYNGTWVNVYTGAGVWNAWVNVTFTETSTTKMRFRFHNNHPIQPLTAYVYESDFLQDVPPANYELDLEVQWTSVDYGETEEELCVYAGDTGAEDLRVDYWTGSVWSNLLMDLTANGWNNVSLSLTSAAFTIRFKGCNETGDTSQDSWEIDVTLLHVWSDEYTSAIEFTGSSNMESWSQLNWTVDGSWTIGSVSVMLQLYNYTLGGYPTSGNGYMTYTSASTPDTDEMKSQIIDVNPTDFRNSTGYWTLRAEGVKASDNQFAFKADWIELSPVKTVGTTFTFKNNGSLTCHLVSLWINNSTVHESYDVTIFINAGETLPYYRNDIIIPYGQHIMKAVTERGNIAVFPMD